MFPCFYQVSDGHAFQGSAFDFLIDGFGGVIVIKNDGRLAPVAIKPCPLDFPKHFIAVMVKEQDSDLVQAGQVHGSGAVVEDFSAEKALIRLFG